MTSPSRKRWALPSWVVEEGIYAASSHEPLKFYRRLGRANPRWRAEWYQAHRTDQFARRMAAAGFNHVNLAFFKGFGLDEERGEIDDLKSRIPVFRRHGIKVRLYVQFGSLMYESFLREVPDAANWARRDSHGRVMTYRWGNQYWRWRPCYNRTETISYLKKCIDLAIEIGADAVGLDNVKEGWGGDYSDYCYCERCRLLFRQYLRERFAGREDIIGISAFDFVEPPPMHDAGDVVCQAWVRFHDERLHAAVAELYSYAKAKKPDLLINANGLPAHLTGQCTDTATWEGHYWPRIENGDIVCAAHAYKHGNDRGIMVYAATTPALRDGDAESPRDPKLRILKLGVACAATFGGHGVFAPAILSEMRGAHFPLDKPSFADTCRKYFHFFRKHRACFYPAESAATAAVYLNWPSWSLDRERVTAAYRLVEQVLLRNHLLFDIFYLRPIAEIRRYDLLIFPDVRCMGDQEIEEISDFVRSGGGIVALGETSRYDEFFRERLDPGLGSLLRVTFDQMTSGGEARVPGRPGPGGVAWFPLAPRLLQPGGWRDFGGLSASIGRILGPDNLPVEVAGPDTVIVDAYKVRGGEQLVVSLLNFDETTKARDIVLRFSGSRFGSDGRAFWASPDAESDELQELPVPPLSAGPSVTVPEVDTYSFVMLRKS